MIGKKMKELRENCKMSLTELSQKSGVQLATLSRIENLKMTGTLDSHLKIAQALKISPPELYSNIIREDSKPEVKTASSNDVFVHSEKSSYEILTNKILSKKMMPILLKIDPKGFTNKEQSEPASEKFIFVLEGKIEIHLDQEVYSLVKNNTLYFNASVEHYFVNKGKTVAKVICVATPVVL